MTFIYIKIQKSHINFIVDFVGVTWLKENGASNFEYFMNVMGLVGGG
jgi:hypothetical protein